MRCCSAHLLVPCAGQNQPELAATALQAIFIDQQKSWRVTLRNANAKGKVRYTQFEMWRATCAADAQPAVLVSTLNVTHQRELELQLQSARDLLQK